MIVLIFWIALQLDPQTQKAFLGFFEHHNQFSATFSQVTESPFLETTRSSGVLSISRPGKFKMEYLSGEEKRVLCDGITYFEEDLLAETQSRTPLKDIEGEPLIRILVFGEDLQTYFLVDRTKLDDGTDVFRLRPRNDTAYYLEMTFDCKWFPTSIAFISSEGERTQLFLSEFTLVDSFPAEWFKIPPS